MKKRMVSLLLCFCMVIGVLPMSVLAAQYDGWAAATADGITLTADTDTITIDGVSYTYKGDASTSGIRMYTEDAYYSATALTETCCWKAGSGYVLYKPTVESGETISAVVTLHDAAISASNAFALSLPFNSSGPYESPVPVTVTVEGTNSLATPGASYVALYHSAGNTTFTGGGSLSITGGLSLRAAVTIDSGTQVTVSGMGNYITGDLTVTGSGSKLTLADGASLAMGVFGGTPTATVTVENGAVLENNGTLWMGEQVDKDNSHIVGGEISGNGAFQFGSNSQLYCLVDGVFYAYGGDVSTSGLDLSSSTPTITIRYKAGNGYIRYIPATTDPAANAKLELHGAEISTTDADALRLPSAAPLDIVVASDSSLTAGGSGNVIFANGQALPVTGSGGLTLAGPYYGINGTGAVSINIDGDLTFDTVYQPIACGDNITVSAKSITSKSGYYFQSASSVSLTATDGDIVFDETGKTNKSNKIYANQDITLNAPNGKIDIAHSNSGSYALANSSGTITVSALHNVIINAVSGGGIDASGAVSVTSQSGSIQMNCGDYYECVNASGTVGAITLRAAEDMTLSGSGASTNAISASGRTVDITAGGKLTSTSAYGFQVGALTIRADEVSITGTTQDGIQAGSVSITNTDGTSNCESVSITSTSSDDSRAAIYCGDVTIKTNAVFLCGNDSAKAVIATGIVTIGDAGLTVGAIEAGTDNIDSRIIRAAYGADASSGLNLYTTTPTQVTYYRAGDGYALFAPATGATPTTLTLHNATIYNTTVTNDATGHGIALPDGAVTIAVEGTNTIEAQHTDAIYGSNTDIILSGAGVLHVGHLGITLQSTAANPHSFTKGTGVTLNGIVIIFSDPGDTYTVYGNVTLPSGAHYMPMGGFTVTEDAVLTIPQGAVLDLEYSTSINNNGTIVNNGKIILPTGADTAAIQALQLTGGGMVQVGSNYYTNDGTAVTVISGGLTLTGSDSGTTVADDGYRWDGSTLTLGNAYVDGSLTLPDNQPVVINATSDSVIGGSITGTGSYPIDFTFTGTSPLSINGGISGFTNGDTVTVTGGADVTINGSISIGASGTDGTLTIAGAGTALNITSDLSYGAMCDTINVQNGASLTAHSAGSFGLEALAGGVHVTGGSALTVGCDYGVYVQNGSFAVDDSSTFTASAAVAAVCVVDTTHAMTQSQALAVSSTMLSSGTQITSAVGNTSGYGYTYWSIASSASSLTATNENNTPATLAGALGALTLKKASSGTTGGTPSSGGNSSTNYTLTFATNGGSAVTSLPKASGTVVDLSGYKPTRDGYTFAGWYSDEAFTTKVTSVTLTKSITVYAKWTGKTAQSTNSFADVADNAYYRDAVLWAVENNVTSGTSDTAFSPSTNCTRAQAVTFLWRAEGSPEPTAADCPFTDVSASSYYYKAVLWAVERGITDGITSTTFVPNGIVTRGQAVTFLWRAAGNPASSSVNAFTDISPNEYCCDAVAWAVEQGIAQGTSDTAFLPNSSCTRSQIVTFLYRYIGK